LVGSTGVSLGVLVRVLVGKTGVLVPVAVLDGVLVSVLVGVLVDVLLGVLVGVLVAYGAAGRLPAPATAVLPCRAIYQSASPPSAATAPA
jgi:hypothetical protein